MENLVDMFLCTPVSYTHLYESRKHTTGYERLEAVLIEAKGTPVDQCWLSRDTVWIGNSQKKGVCHILINENVLKGWVRSDAASI